jgi:hypothetical protein
MLGCGAGNIDRPELLSIKSPGDEEKKIRGDKQPSASVGPKKSLSGLVICRIK